MTRTEFEQLRDLRQKSIKGTIKFGPKQPKGTFLFTGKIPIENSLNVKLILEINYNPLVEAKTFVVRAPESGGNICRLCVDGSEHEPYGDCHRHCMADEDCQKTGQMHKDMEELAHLTGKGLATLFRYFCKTAKIQFQGTFYGADNTQWTSDEQNH